MGFELANFRLEMLCLNQVNHIVPHLNCVYVDFYMIVGFTFTFIISSNKFRNVN